MMIVETIGKIRRMFRDQHSIREISRTLRLSRKVVRKALRSDTTAFAYKRQRQPRPQLDSHVAPLEALLVEELAKPKRQRLSYVRLFEILRQDGFTGGYDSVRRYAQRWFKDRTAIAQGVFVPLAFAPGEPYATSPRTRRSRARVTPDVHAPCLGVRGRCYVQLR
ncbi:hypothetical protein [Methylobacterium sp. J-068]|uniref:hypothetical protein n=1 Tax=Methylobacterium sp. J-068 TaxID=2836649 RepID=UPI001FB90216|nr:hypothetical protein [Methylobacterium sp. J-068]MCJ2034726.1 hypothetical protein [Methylobacterium sp. J-068]